MYVAVSYPLAQGVSLQHITPKLKATPVVPGGQGLFVGDTPLGTTVGDALDTDVGAALPPTVGDALGTDVGAALPPTVGDALGTDVGAALPTSVGDALGTDVGAALPTSVGDALGTDVGAALPATVGDALGVGVGAVPGVDGLTVADDLDGSTDGANVGGTATQLDRSALRT